MIKMDKVARQHNNRGLCKLCLSILIVGMINMNGVSVQAAMLNSNDVNRSKSISAVVSNKVMVIKEALMKPQKVTNTEESKNENTQGNNGTTTLDTDLLRDKKVLALGDSIMYGYGNAGVGIAEMLGNQYKWELLDYARTGATVGWLEEYAKLESSSGKRKNIQHQLNMSLKRLKESPDYIFINGGTNDIKRDVPIGQLSYNGKYDKNTYIGALEYIFNSLEKAYPTAQIIYIGAHSMPTKGIGMQLKFRNSAMEVCRKWNVEMVDILTHSELNTNLSYYSKYTVVTPWGPLGDNVHPTKEGYEKFYLPYVIQKLVEYEKGVLKEKQSIITQLEPELSKY